MCTRKDNTASATRRRPRIDPQEETLHRLLGGEPASPPRTETLHRSPDGDPTSAPERTAFIGHQKDTLHLPSDGHPAEAVVP